MNESVIEVKPISDLVWGVWLGDVCIGKSNHSCDCDFAAEQLAKVFEYAIVNHHNDERRTIITKMEELRKSKRNNRGVA